MKLFRAFALLMALLFSTDFIVAQVTAPACAWPAPRKDARSLLLQKKAEQRLQQVISRFDAGDADTLYTLPIVVHIIHTGTPVGSADNPTDAQVMGMIQTLNDSWRRMGSAYGGADMKIQFQLALRGPGCSATTAINRVNGSSIPNYASGGIGVNGFPGSADEALVKNLSRWSNADYINIWIVNKINGTSTAIGGYAYFAEYSDAATDGIVMNAQYANGNSKAISHEMGHVFELYHTFHDDGNETTCARLDSCSFFGDRVCDTESGPLARNCSNTFNPCVGANYAIADVSKNYSVLNNHMNYTDCAWMFTEGQKTRARAALLAFRPALIHSAALKPLPVASPTVACIPSSANGMSQFYGVERVLFNTIDVYSNTSEGDRASYVDRSCNQRTTVYRGQTYQLQVNGSHQNPHSFKAYLDYNNDGDFDDPGESILTGYGDVATASVTIPAAGIPIGVPLRLRIIADNPAPGYPTYPSPCAVDGHSDGYGAGQAEDYAVIVANGPVQSITSGGWNTPGTWDCNCIPVAGDKVTIKAGHNVFITQAMGIIDILSLTLEAGGSFNMGPNAVLRQQK